MRYVLDMREYFQISSLNGQFESIFSRKYQKFLFPFKFCHVKNTVDPSVFVYIKFPSREVNEFCSNNTRVFIDFLAMIVKRTNLFVSFYFSHQISICFLIQSF